MVFFFCIRLMDEFGNCPTTGRSPDDPDFQLRLAAAAPGWVHDFSQTLLLKQSTFLFSFSCFHGHNVTEIPSHHL